MPLAILFHFLCAQHVSDIHISIIRSMRLCWWITTSVVLQASACKTNTTQNQPHQISNTQRTENKTTDVVIHQHSRKLLMMDIWMSETCWAHKKWNKIASGIKLVFHSSAIKKYQIIHQNWKALINTEPGYLSLSCFHSSNCLTAFICIIELTLWQWLSLVQLNVLLTYISHL